VKKIKKCIWQGRSRKPCYVKYITYIGQGLKRSLKSSWRKRDLCWVLEEKRSLLGFGGKGTTEVDTSHRRNMWMFVRSKDRRHMLIPHGLSALMAPQDNQDNIQFYG
jgi:hypothetical protein